MIHKLSANQSSFHEVTFSKGLNVVLADRSASSTKKDTRNGVGKSTLIDIIDFCLGSNASKGKGLIIDVLEEWMFTLTITLSGNRVSVSRSVSQHKYVTIEGTTDGWSIQPELDEESGQKLFSIIQWRRLLGSSLFELASYEDSLTYKPSYRSLISYFIRSGAESYSSPFKHFPQQKTWDTQLHVAYLLGMNWDYASKWQALKDQEAGINAFEKAIKSGVIERTVGSIGELETQKIQLEQQYARAKEELDTFKVHPQYSDFQIDADRITSEIHELTNKNIKDRRQLSVYQQSISDESPPEATKLEKLYNESGVVFPDMVIKSIADAREFHKNIISNRSHFLESEISRIQVTVQLREKQIEDLTNQRAEMLEVLSSHGALEEYNKLQRQNMKVSARLQDIEQRIKEVKEIASKKRETRTAKTELVSIAESEHEERRTKWSSAVRLFNDHSQYLYKSPGKLIIDINDNGYKFQVDIERSGSEGIEKMKIFCFDLASLRLQLKQNHGIDFLIHDSLLYDAVDARQRALALELASEVTTSTGSQYICALNSDMVPRNEFSSSFQFDDCVRLTLSDASPKDSLLGIRFDRPND